MDLATIIGIFGGLALIVVAIAQRQGSVEIFINVPSLFITFGGTIAAILVHYPIRQVFRVIKISSKVLVGREEDPTHLIEKLIWLTRLARREGVLVLERETGKIENPFLRRAIQLVADGATQERLKTELNTEIAFMRKRHRVGQEIFTALGTYSPAFGMLGTIVGLILMLVNIQDQSQIAAGMAVALLTTFYGVLSSYLIFLPMAGKLKQRCDEETFIKQVVIEGALSLQSGENPTVMEERLKAYLAPHLREKIKRIELPTPESKEEEKKEEK